MVSTLMLATTFTTLCMLFATGSNAYAADSGFCQWTNNVNELWVGPSRGYLDPDTNIDIPLRHGSYYVNEKDGSTKYSLTQSSNSFWLLNGISVHKDLVYIIQWESYPDSLKSDVKKTYVQLNRAASCHFTINVQDGQDDNGKIAKVSVQEVHAIYD